jgi:hypothetical protein
MMAIANHLGVCCTCQEPNEIIDNPDFNEDDFDLSDPFTGKEDQYVMAPHKADGSWCEGAGTVPQAIYAVTVWK